MKAVAITGPRQCELIDQTAPKAKDQFVVVKIHSAPMCTEYHGYEKGGKTQGVGHEAAGEVVEVARPGKVKVGDRVVVMPQHSCGKCHLCLAGEYIHCENGINAREATGNESGTAMFAQYVIKQDWMLVPIPDGMSYDHASMACCGLGPTFGGMQLMSVVASDTVLVTGLGPVGLGAVVNARFRGARVIGADAHPYRAALAKELGAEAVIDPTAEDAVKQVMDLTGGVGADKGIETSGVAAAKPLLVEAVRRKGQIALVGWDGQLEAGRIIGKGLTIHGAWHWNLGHSREMMEMISRVGDQLDKQITHTFPMSQVGDAWELQLTGECGKIILHPWK